MSWSLDTWGNQDRLSAADTFLRTGIVATTFGGTGCTSSTQCASGYKCSGGRCVPIQTAGGSGGSGGVSTGGGSSPCDGGGDGSNSGNTGPGGSGCSSPAPTGGGGGGCTTSTCGQGTYAYGEDSDCCGERCCRYFGTGSGVSVNCYCGPCPGSTGQRCGDGYAPCLPGLTCINGYCTEVKPCNQFCSEYYEANGTLSAGCSRDYICDECTECSGSLDGGGNYCEGKNNLPCHCNGAEVEECDICNDDGSISPGECLECCEISNYDCGGGTAVSAKVCQERGISGPSVCNLAQDAARQRCAEELGGGGSGGGDNCKPVCDSKTTPPAAGPCPSPDDPIGDCPDGFDCQWTGCIEAGGQHVTLYNECNVAELPDECKACDCNCNNDCPDCQLCGADGTCHPDPECEGDYATTWFKDRISYVYYGCSYSPGTGTGGCVTNNPTAAVTSLVDITTACGPLPHTIVQTRRSALVPYGPCKTGGTATFWRVKDGDGNWITGEFSQGGVGGTFCSDLDTSAPPSLVGIIKC